MNKFSFYIAFAIGLVVVGWVGLGFVDSSGLALVMTVVIAGVYALGAWELLQFREASGALAVTLARLPPAMTSLSAWMESVPSSLRNSVRLRIEGERVSLPGPALTPYLVGLLVMLGMLGTFLGMVLTFKGAVFALEGSTDLQAIRSALAAPIKGLGLSFGTSVAGVATSAMLGLMSALSRRERLDVGRLLDTQIAGVFRPFSRAYQREESLRALQTQSLAIPAVVEQLQALVSKMDQRQLQLNAQLTEQQEQFHHSTSLAYAKLADSVAKTLQESLLASTRIAGECVQPVVEAAMAAITSEAQRQQAQVSDTVQTQLHALGTRMLDGQSRVCQVLESTGRDILQHVNTHSNQAMEGVGRLLERSEALIQMRSDAEAGWAQQQGERMDQLVALWRHELGALRDEEAARGRAAVERLAELQTAVSRQLETLGTALEAPLGRLMQTASEAPRAAAALITQLHAEMTRLTARDNRALEERLALMERINALLAAADTTTTEQRAAIDALVASAATVLDKASGQFAQVLDAQADKASDVAVHVSSSAIELASLGESFHVAVKLFQEANTQMIASLQRIEAAVGQSMARSDEQLAYYVGQAREVIDLSLSSQKAVVEDLRRLHGKQSAPAKPAEAVL